MRMIPLTLSTMQRCYMNCCFGNSEPTHVFLSPARFDEYLNLIMKTLKLNPHVIAPLSWNEFSRSSRFNNAKVEEVEKLSDQVINIVTASSPDNLDLNHYFFID